MTLPRRSGSTVSQVLAIRVARSPHRVTIGLAFQMDCLMSSWSTVQQAKCMGIYKSSFFASVHQID